MGHVWDAGQHAAELLIQRVDELVKIGNTVANGAHALLEFGRIDALTAKLADFGALSIALRLQLFGFRYGLAAPGIEFAELRCIKREATCGQAFCDRVQIGPEKR